MISKEKLTEIVQKSVEDAWYNRRSLNPVKEQTEIITNAIWEQLNEPDVSVNEAFGFRRGVAGCPLCNGRGEYHTGGSFGGSVEVHQCECTKGQTEH